MRKACRRFSSQASPSVQIADLLRALSGHRAIAPRATRWPGGFRLASRDHPVWRETRLRPPPPDRNLPFPPPPPPPPSLPPPPPTPPPPLNTFSPPPTTP